MRRVRKEMIGSEERKQKVTIRNRIAQRVVLTETGNQEKSQLVRIKVHNKQNVFIKMC